VLQIKETRARQGLLEFFAARGVPLVTHDGNPQRPAR
jgi:hypothetical protein